MKENKLKIKIDRPIVMVFEFTINPDNTPLWVDIIVKEEANLPIKLGTRYSNTNRFEEVSEYIVSRYIPNEVFELESLHSDYRVRYTYKTVENNATELEYFEWVTSGDLNEPFTLDILEKLKTVIESQ
ncbi:MAG TPA: hypothetical protein PK720_01220 [bacterium]|nr:hypothetical protein [bacterium]